jgi:magnesium transporter
MKNAPSSRRINDRRVSKKGLPPGAHVYTGRTFLAAPDIEMYSYNREGCTVSHPTPDEITPEAGDRIQWINLNGINHIEAVKSLCETFHVHYLYQEDILNVFQRPKVEIEDSYVFLTFKSLEWDEALHHVTEEQISILLTNKVTLSFQEKPGDHFGYLRDKLTSDISIIRQRQADYLFYRLLDITVDSYFDLLEKIGNTLETLENKILVKPENSLLTEIQATKKDLMVIRRNIYPMRDLLNRLISSDHPLIDQQTIKYFRDVQDHTIQIIETVETFREMNISLKDAYLNTLSHEMNKIMKVLTIISTLFIPLTFIAGVYGMNFRHMPELEWTHGYSMAWGIMVSVGVSLIFWFRRKGWF